MPALSGGPGCHGASAVFNRTWRSLLDSDRHCRGDCQPERRANLKGGVRYGRPGWTRKTRVTVPCRRDACLSPRAHAESTIWILADVRHRTSDVRHRIIPMLPYDIVRHDVRCRTRTTSYVPTYDIVRAMSYVMTYDVATYDIVRPTYDVVRHVRYRTSRRTTSYNADRMRYRRFGLYIVYDIVCDVALFPSGGRAWGGLNGPRFICRSVFTGRFASTTKACQCSYSNRIQ